MATDVTDELRGHGATPTPASRSPVGRLIGLCLRNKLVVAVAVLLVGVWGLGVAPFPWALGGSLRAPISVDAIPDIGENQQIVFAEWPGRSPQDVEDQVTYPLTASLLGLPGVATIRSNSMFGFAMLYVVFDEDVEFYWSRARVLEKLESLPRDTLPEGVVPILGPDATALGQVFWYTLEGLDDHGDPTGGWDLHELRAIQDWTVRYALLSVVGVSEVASVGGFVQEYQVDVDPDALQAYQVTLEDVLNAVKTCNVDVGARTIEINRVEYFIRSIGFAKHLADIKNAVIDVRQSVPIKVGHVAQVTLGPALRRGALDKGGAEAVGGVIVARYGANPLDVIQGVKEKISEITPGLPRKTLADGSTSQVHIVPFHDRSHLIHETLGTLDAALTQEVLITVIVVVLVFSLRAALLVAGLLPLSVLMCFVAMKVGKIDANIVALSGIAIAIGTIVDMGVIVCERTLVALEQSGPNADRMAVVRRAATEVGGAVLTAVATTIVSFLPVFTLEAAEGKLFRPLAYTKTFALVASVVIALTVIPSAVYLLYGRRIRWAAWRVVFHTATILIGAVVAFMPSYHWLGGTILLVGVCRLITPRMSPSGARRVGALGNALIALLVVGVLARHWLPLGAEGGIVRNGLFVVVLVGGLLGMFKCFELGYAPILRWCLAHKATFLSMPLALLVFGLYVWMGPAVVWGPMAAVAGDPASMSGATQLLDDGLLERRGDALLWTREALDASPETFAERLDSLDIADREAVRLNWSKSAYLHMLRGKRWGAPDQIRDAPFTTRLLWTLARDWNGRGREFMPPLDEGSFLYMPVTMPHASIGEVYDVLQKQDMAIQRIPEVDMVVGKLGRAESPLDPAPVSMIETIVNYKPEFLLDEQGRRRYFRFNEDERDFFRDALSGPVSAPDGQPYLVQGRFLRDEKNRLIEDPHGRPFRLWRPALNPALNPGRAAWRGIVGPRSVEQEKSEAGPVSIWDAIVAAAQIPGTTSAPQLAPIAARIVMLQSGMRAAMGVRIKGPTLEAIASAGMHIEGLLRSVPEVDASTVIADRIIGKPYLEIEIDREAIARYGIRLKAVQDVIEVAVGGKPMTTTVEGRERFPVRVRYLRELRDTVEDLGRILVEGHDDANRQVPVTLFVRLDQIARIHITRGPQVIKSEDTFLVGHVLFDKRDGYAQVTAVEAARAALDRQRENGSLALPEGVSYTFIGDYENQVRSEQRLMVLVPLSLLIIAMILYLHFRSVSTTVVVFSGVAVAWAGGFVMLWLYAQPWFLDVSLFGRNMRDVFQVHPMYLSVAVWVGFLALFGIATDDGVVMASYLKSTFSEDRPCSREAIRACVLTAGARRVRPCLMTTATTILALIPVLTSTGRGSDIMVPMAIPTFGGMVFEVMTMLVVPTLYCAVQEGKARWRRTTA